MTSLYIWPTYPLPSLIVLILVTMTFLYLVREPVGRALASLRKSAGGGLRQLADWTKASGERLREHDRKILLESGIARAEQKVAHELIRLQSTYTERLAAYPDLHLRLDESLSKIDADYTECGSVPPKVPGWGDVVESLTRVQDSGSGRVVEKLLVEIQKSAVAGEKKALQEYRAEMAKRHKILSGMAPEWKKLGNLMEKVKKVVAGAVETTTNIDRYIKDYEELQEGREASAAQLGARARRVFVFALIVMAVAAGGAFINFQLIALPMSELVPAGGRMMGMPVADVAALVIVALELVVGIFLMETIGITSIFPQLASQSRSKRRAILIAAATGLFFLASVEASLAILREQLVEAEVALRQSLAGSEAVADAQRSLIPVVGQATLGFILPWILAMVAVPLEMLIESGQHVAVNLLALLLGALGYVSRLLAYLLEALLDLLKPLYEAYIVIPGLVAQLVVKPAAKLRSRGRARSAKKS